MYFIANYHLISDIWSASWNFLIQGCYVTSKEITKGLNHIDVKNRVPKTTIGHSSPFLGKDNLYRNSIP